MRGELQIVNVLPTVRATVLSTLPALLVLTLLLPPAAAAQAPSAMNAPPPATPANAAPAPTAPLPTPPAAPAAPADPGSPATPPVPMTPAAPPPGPATAPAPPPTALAPTAPAPGAAPGTPAAAPEAGSGSRPPGSYVVKPVRLSHAPKMDGTMSDPVWAEAAHIAGFRQLEPHEGAPASEPTDVYIGYDKENLYVAARCHDSQPDKMVANILTRDGDLSYDDMFQIIIDTYHDGRSGFLFGTNPLGVEVDALVRNEGEEVNYNWDGIWRCLTSRNKDGYIVEMEIPFKTLRFPAKPQQDWGFNILRYIPRKFERSLWTPMLHSYGIFAYYAVSKYGEMTGLENIDPGSRYDFQPYLLAGAKHDDGKPWQRDLNAGGDLKIKFGTDLVADLTYRTDFAETEADEQVVNLTRFNYYLPEKRQFFLEGANLFYVGERPEPQHAAETILFFSRQIGLTADGLQEVPVIGGAKLTGHEGAYSIGMLSMETAALGIRDAFGNVERQPDLTYSVFRVRRDFAGNSYIGVLGLSKEGAGDHNRVGGADWDIGLNDYLRTGGYFVQSSTDNVDLPQPSGETWAGSGDLYWNSRAVRAHLEYAQIGTGFNDEMGFITRTGVRQWRWDSNYYLWPEDGIFHQAWFTYDLDYITDLQTGQFVTRINNIQAATFFKDSSGVALKWYEELEGLSVPFQVHPGITIPSGFYDFKYWFFGFQTDYSKEIGGAGRLTWGDFYDGTQLRMFYALVYRPLPGLYTAYTYEHDRVDLREGRFNTDLFQTEITYAFTTTLSTRFWLNYDRLNNLRAKFVFDWEYKPGANFYIVYQDIRNYTDIFDPQQPLAGLPGKEILSKVVFRIW
jgi:hypothetical protein